MDIDLSTEAELIKYRGIDCLALPAPKFWQSRFDLENIFKTLCRIHGLKPLNTTKNPLGGEDLLEIKLVTAYNKDDNGAPLSWDQDILLIEVERLPQGDQPTDIIKLS